MRKLRALFICVLVIAFLATNLIGCRPAPNVPTIKDVQGKWVAIKKETYGPGTKQVEKNPGFVVEFLSDKTALLPLGQAAWDILDDGHLKIEISGMIMQGRVEGNLMTIDMPDKKGMVVLKRQ